MRILIHSHNKMLHIFPTHMKSDKCAYDLVCNGPFPPPLLPTDSPSIKPENSKV